MVIKDKAGNARQVRERKILVDNIEFGVTRWRPDGTKSTRFFNAYEIATGHW